VSDRSDPFRNMAASLDLNEGKPFGGALVIIPPAGGDPIEMLILDSREDAMQFYMTIKTMVEVAYNELLIKQQQNKVFGGLR
jgi:hypothetical protein